MVKKFILIRPVILKTNNYLKLCLPDMPLKSTAIIVLDLPVSLITTPCTSTTLAQPMLLLLVVPPLSFLQKALAPSETTLKSRTAVAPGAGLVLVGVGGPRSRERAKMLVQVG